MNPPGNVYATSIDLAVGFPANGIKSKVPRDSSVYIPPVYTDAVFTAANS